MPDAKIALTTNTPYLPHTMVAMLSVLENAKRPVSVHILGDELSAAARKVVEEGCRRGGHVRREDATRRLSIQYGGAAAVEVSR